MESQKENPSNTSWLYRLLVIILIPFLYIYYAILQPIGIYFKELVAEQGGSLRQRQAVRRPANVKRAFVIDAAAILALTLARYLHKYWWLAAALFFLWLGYVNGFGSAVADFALWFMIWIVYITIRSFIKGVNA